MHTMCKDEFRSFIFFVPTPIVATLLRASISQPYLLCTVLTLSQEVDELERTTCSGLSKYFTSTCTFICLCLIFLRWGLTVLPRLTLNS